MPFADVVKDRQESKFQKAEFMTLTPGQYLIRILDDTPLAVYKHWIHELSVKCLGDECPQCKLNQQLIEEYKENFRDIPGYSSRSLRYLVNVLDLTPVKLCANCNTENPRSATACIKCGSFLTNPPVACNRVKVIEKGDDLFKQFKSTELYLQGLEDVQKKPITAVEIVLNVSGQKPRYNYSAIPTGDAKPMPEGIENAKYDLDKLSVILTPKEMLKLMSGVKAKDIFAGRSASSKKEEEVTELNFEANKAYSAADEYIKQMMNE